MTLAEILSFERYLEPAAATVLTTGGFTVISPFVAVDAEGNPNLTGVPDHHCIVAYEAGMTEDTTRVFQAGSERPVSVPGGFRGTLKITHQVPVDNAPVAPGVTPGCYQRLLEQRGAIRALFLAAENPLAALCPQYDFLSLTLAQPDRRMDPDRTANTATELFDLRFIPTSLLE